MCEQCQRASCSSQSLPKDSEILSCYLRMGHLNFNFLKTLFPYIISNKKLYDLGCEIYELNKCHRKSCPKSKYTQFKPFILIHSYLWDHLKL